MKKRFFAFLLAITLVFNFSVSVYAEVPPTYQKTKEYLWQIVQDIGFIGTLPFKGIVELVNEIINAKGISGEQEVTTEDEALDYAFDGISINGNGNIVLNDNAKLNINTLIDNYVNDNKYYVGYSLDLSNYSKTYWWTSDLENVLTLYSDQYYIFAGADGGMYSSWWYYLFDKSKFAPVWRSDLGSGLSARYGVDFFNTKTFDRSAPEGGCFYFKKTYNGSIGSITETTPQAIYANNRYFQIFVNSHKFISSEYSLPLQNNYLFVSDGSTDSITIYGTQNLLSTYGRGYAPYYYNESVYNDFSSSSGDFTISPDNRNYVSYGDVTTYIDDHHTETGTYPSIPDINIWIEDQPRPTPSPTPTPDNPSGGGSSGGATATANNEGINININNNHNINVGLPSLSGNTVSGNGSGSSGGIFDWISSIGGVIGDFIKNVGQLLADVIKGISETITTVLSTLPNLLSGIVEFVYGGLPDELKALVTLGLTAVVLVSVIKILRK